MPRPVPNRRSGKNTVEVVWSLWPCHLMKCIGSSWHPLCSLHNIWPKCVSSQSPIVLTPSSQTNVLSVIFLIICLLNFKDQLGVMLCYYCSDIIIFICSRHLDRWSCCLWNCSVGVLQASIVTTLKTYNLILPYINNKPAPRSYSSFEIYVITTSTVKYVGYLTIGIITSIKFAHHDT